MQCISCGEKLPAGKKFCGICGASQTNATPTTPVTELLDQAEFDTDDAKASGAGKKRGLFIGLGAVAVLAIAATAVWIFSPKPKEAEEVLPSFTPSMIVSATPTPTPTVAFVDTRKFNCDSLQPLMDEGWAPADVGTDAPAAIMCFFEDTTALFRFNVDYAPESEWLDWKQQLVTGNGAYQDLGALVPGAYVLARTNTDPDTGFEMTEYQAWIDGLAIDTNCPIAGVSIEEALNLLHTQVTG